MQSSKVIMRPHCALYHDFEKKFLIADSFRNVIRALLLNKTLHKNALTDQLKNIYLSSKSQGSSWGGIYCWKTTYNLKVRSRSKIMSMGQYVRTCTSSLVWNTYGPIKLIIKAYIPQLFSHETFSNVVGSPVSCKVNA